MEGLLCALSVVLFVLLLVFEICWLSHDASDWIHHHGPERFRYRFGVPGKPKTGIRWLDPAAGLRRRRRRRRMSKYEMEQWLGPRSGDTDRTEDAEASGVPEQPHLPHRPFDLG